MSENEIWKSVRNLLKCSNCLKVKIASGVIKEGKIIAIGFNLCAPKPYSYGDKLSNCPRMEVKTGTNYQLCSCVHSEVMACLNIRPNRNYAEIAKFAAYEINSESEIRSVFNTQELNLLRGSELYLTGHYWVCESCKNFLNAVDIKVIKFDGVTGENTNSPRQSE